MEEKRMALLELDSLSSMFERCVDNWLDEQTNRFAEMLHNCIQLERKNKWVALEQSGVSASVVDLFQMFHESLSQLFSIGVPLSKDQILSFVQQVDLFVMKYCNDVLTHHYKNKTFRMDPEALIPKFTVRRDALDKMADKMEEYFTAEGRLAAKGRREMNRAPKGEEVSMQQKMKKMFTTGKSNKQEGNKSDGNSQHARSKSDELDNKTSSHDKEDEVSDRFEKVERKLEKLFGGGGGGHHADPVELLPHKEERLQEQDLVGLCVRIKNLSWSKQQAISLEQDVKYLWGKERSRRQYLMLATQDEDGRNADDDLGDLLVNCQMALHHGQKTLIEYVATKIVFFDLREDFVGRLYFPSPSSYRLLPLLAQDGQLDSMLTEMSAEMLAVDGFSDLLWEILEKVCENIIRLLEWCLVGEQMGSIARHCDEKETGTIAEDLVSLKNYFVQRDEEGNSNGLDEEVVTSKTARLQLITNRILSEPSKSLIALFQDPHLPDDDDKDIMNRRIILGALDHRTDKAARDFVKEHRKKR
uniref:MHD1 domain-containing protein n=1 Tax=Hanusia phi TaxID=3032 RepID=A0A7S0EU62_9CRYP